MFGLFGDLDGYILAFLIAIYLLKDTITGYPPEASCLPKRQKLCPTGPDDVGCCPTDHYYKDFPKKQKKSLEHFGDFADVGNHTTGTCQTCKTVKLGMYAPMYTGYMPWSYAYGGRPYGMYRPWWSATSCN